MIIKLNNSIEKDLKTKNTSNEEKISKTNILGKTKKNYQNSTNKGSDYKLVLNTLSNGNFNL